MSPRSFDLQPSTRAGVLLLRWASESAPYGIETLSKSVGVSPRTIRRWIVGSQSPPIRDAHKILEITGIPLVAWVQPATLGSVSTATVGNTKEEIQKLRQALRAIRDERLLQKSISTKHDPSLK